MTASSMRLALLPLLASLAASASPLAAAQSGGESWPALEKQFRELPMAARRLTGPLFWLHGDESAERLEAYLEKVAEGGNGCFTAESRPHNDWLGPGWYRDLAVCLRAAKRLDLQMWIFDERWWPSGEVAGRVPQRFASKYLEVETADVAGPARVTRPLPAERLVAVLAGRDSPAGVLGDTLQDLSSRVVHDRLVWDAPSGPWKVMIFRWRPSEGRRGRLLVDGASRDAVQWYIRTVYAPHYERFAEDFGGVIQGYFYDEPETLGDWGTEVIPMLQERGVDWKKALVAWKLQLAGDEQAAARYQYQDALAEAWGRTLYGGLSRWCRQRGVRSIGHFLEHKGLYLSPRACAGNMIQLQKYSDMGGIDAVFRQFAPGERDPGLWQTPKLGSSISHAYGKEDDLAMVEIFGARGQDLTYAEMKWWTDHMHVSGINFHIPHSFNPRAPYDRDCPPYFYNGGYEPRWPLYRVYADYTSRLSLLLSGGRHVCPVALLFVGNSAHVGRAITPEQLSAALQDALLDCDWIPYDVWERDMRIEPGGRLRLRGERYRVLVAPPAEVVPYETLRKAREFFEAGGVVVGYGLLPSRSATLGVSAEDIAAERKRIWGPDPQPGLTACHTSPAGGRAYFLPAEPTVRQLRRALVDDAGVQPALDVVDGDTGGWVHALHRVRSGRDVFFVCNQHHEGRPLRLTLRLQAAGVPECWDPMRNEIRALRWRPDGEGAVRVQLTLAPLESVLLVFQPAARPRPLRLDQQQASPLWTQPIEGRIESCGPSAPPRKAVEAPSLDGCPWVWHPEVWRGGPPPGRRCFRGRILLPPDAEIRRGRLRLTADNQFTLYINGKPAGQGADWSRSWVVDLTRLLRPGANVVAVAAANGGDGPNPAGLIGKYEIELADGRRVDGRIDADWKVSDQAPEGWTAPAFDDSRWAAAAVVGVYGDAPWGRVDDTVPLTVSPVQGRRFAGEVTISAERLAPGRRVCLEWEGADQPAAAVAVNGRRAGGVIGRPLRLDVTRLLRPGRNTVRIEPYAPRRARLAAYAEGP